jgi:hypothetical protein
VRVVRVVRQREPRRLGLFKGEITIHDDFDVPLPEDLATAFRREGSHQPNKI